MSSSVSSFSGWEIPPFSRFLCGKYVQFGIFLVGESVQSVLPVFVPLGETKRILNNRPLPRSVPEFPPAALAGAPGSPWPWPPSPGPEEPP